MDIDLRQFIPQFEEEAAEQLANLSAGLLALEAEPGNRALVQELFRAAHTIKGSARLLGFERVGALAHQLEDVLDALRAGQVQVTPQVCDVLLEATDLLGALVRETVTGAPADADPGPLADRLADLLPGPGRRGAWGAEPPPATGAGAGERAGGGERALHDAAVPNAPALDQTIRVQVEKVDRLLNLAGELVVSKVGIQRRVRDLRELQALLTQVERGLRALGSAPAAAGRADATGAAVGAARVQTLLGQLRDAAALAETLATRERQRGRDLANLIDELEADIMRMRMLPLTTILGTFRRVVREQARARGKEVRLLLEGEDTEVDKQVLEKLFDPLVHLVRNAIDHGIEPPERREAVGKPRVGTVTIRAHQQGNRVVVTVNDDGAGIAPDRLRRVAVARGLLTAVGAAALDDRDLLELIFLPGFSTSERVTATSGRGVGLDVVRENVAQLKGALRVESAVGQGTTFTLELPLSLAVARVLLVEAAGRLYALQTGFVQRLEEIDSAAVATVQDRPAVRLGARTVPLVTLHQALGLAARAPTRRRLLVVLGPEDRPVALQVDKIIDEQDVVIKSLGPLFARARLVSGGAILATGEIAIVLDVPALLSSVRMLPRERPPAGDNPTPATRRRTVLLAEDALTTRELLRSILESAGYTVEAVPDGATALARLGQRAFDVVVSDVEMPHLDGFQLTTQIRQHPTLRDLPVVLVTSLASEADRRRGLEVGANAYLTKSSFDQETLLAALRRLTG